MYYQLYSILSDFIYGADVVLTEFQDLTLTLMSTTGALFVVSLPFLLVYRVVRMIVG